MDDFKRQLSEGSVCYARSSKRERKKPSACHEGYKWQSGTSYCINLDASKKVDAEAKGKAEKAAAGKDAPVGSVPAMCDANSDFKEKHGAWCQKDCPKGLYADETKCKTDCGTPGSLFPHDGMKMCGKTA